MKQLNFYKYAALGLLILNISMIAFFFLTKPKHPQMPPPEREGMQNRANDILQLDGQQHEMFLNTARNHNEKMRSIESQQKELLKNYFNSLTDTSNLANVQQNLNGYTKLEQQKIEATYQHFIEIKEILNQNQLNDFETFMKDALIILLPSSHKKNPHPPKE